MFLYVRAGVSRFTVRAAATWKPQSSGACARCSDAIIYGRLRHQIYGLSTILVKLKMTWVWDRDTARSKRRQWQRILGVV